MYGIEQNVMTIALFATVISAFFALAALYVQSRKKIVAELNETSTGLGTAKNHEVVPRQDHESISVLQRVLSNGETLNKQPVNGKKIELQFFSRYLMPGGDDSPFPTEQDGDFIWE